MTIMLLSLVRLVTRLVLSAKLDYLIHVPNVMILGSCCQITSLATPLALISTLTTKSTSHANPAQNGVKDVSTTVTAHHANQANYSTKMYANRHAQVVHTLTAVEQYVQIAQKDVTIVQVTNSAIHVIVNITIIKLQDIALLVIVSVLIVLVLVKKIVQLVNHHLLSMVVLVLYYNVLLVHMLNQNKDV